MNADWLAPDAVVVGVLMIETTGITFQSVIPNPTRALQIGIEHIERATLPPARVGAANAIEIGVRDRAPLVFLVADPGGCVLAIEEAIALHKARTAYR
jgi:hypothetical protein